MSLLTDKVNLAVIGMPNNKQTYYTLMNIRNSIELDCFRHRVIDQDSTEAILLCDQYRQQMIMQGLHL